MGEKAAQFFEDAGKSGGLVAKMRLASLARISSTEARSIPDTPEILARLEDATFRLSASASTATPPPPPVSKDGTIATMSGASAETATLRRHLDTYVALMSQRSVFLGDLTATIQRIDEAASFTLDIERVSTWFLDGTRSKITCGDLFVRTGAIHSAGTELFAEDFPPYFRALETERTIPAGNAHSDPRTSCFAEPYLRPLGIGAMLDVPIWLGEKMVGVICHEHVGGSRRWNSDEESFAYLMSGFVALAYERSVGAPAPPAPPATG